jgi:hypothetical protein
MLCNCLWGTQAGWTDENTVLRMSLYAHTILANLLRTLSLSVDLSESAVRAFSVRICNGVDSREMEKIQ